MSYLSFVLLTSCFAMVITNLLLVDPYTSSHQAKVPKESSVFSVFFFFFFSSFFPVGSETTCLGDHCLQGSVISLVLVAVVWDSVHLTTASTPVLVIVRNTLGSFVCYLAMLHCFPVHNQCRDIEWHCTFRLKGVSPYHSVVVCYLMVPQWRSKWTSPSFHQR